MTHTPGPYWMAEDRDPTRACEVWDVGAGDDRLATFDRREDALLYRASPDILAALKMVSGLDIFPDVLRAVDAAIAKAEGKS